MKSTISTTPMELSLRDLRIILDWLDFIRYEDIEVSEFEQEQWVDVEARLREKLHSLDGTVRDKFARVRDGVERPKLVNMRRVRKQLATRRG